MKRLWPTLLLVLVCAGGFWFASSKNFFREAEPKPQAFVTVKAEEVQSLSVESADNQVALQRKDSGWEMTKPGPAPVSANQAESWISSLGLVTQEKLVEEHPANLATYGLDKPLQTYRITLKDGTSKALLVGQPLPIQGYSYAKLEDAPGVYQVSDQSLGLLNHTPVDFIDAQPIAFDADKVQSAKLVWKGQTWLLTKSEKDKPAADAKWKLGDKELTGADASGLLNGLTFLRTSQLTKSVAEAPTAGGELSLEVTLDDNGSAKTQQYEGKLSDTLVWLSQQGGAWAYALTSEDVQKTADDFAAKSK
ncbi:DUF4340 domain-containing protein [Paenibacillus athensensis]|uniref:DUF4340 domain-containing protein n=1 Tax=Paenibacillus athensensis TaxID=1967502 RepID=A0A4Y8Q4N2_9BACL|nr:DUF4340 domain-containing protein [Paenibacillus athensensis]MCD1260779.1 DUF4340 domain-containing protein [Paenibacillus athensensis]